MLFILKETVGKHQGIIHPKYFILKHFKNIIIASGERKPNLDLWLSIVGCPVHGYVQEKTQSCKDTKMATPLDFCRGMSHGQ